MNHFKKNVLFFSATLLFGALGIFLFWKFWMVKKQDLPVGSRENSGEVEKLPLPTVESPDINNGEQIPIPVGFDSVHPSPTLDERAKANFMKQFEIALSEVKEEPSSTWAWLNFGSIKHALGDEKGAEQAWIQATILSPSHPPAYSNLGNLYWHDLIDYAKAEKMFLKYVSLDITATDGYRNLADLYRYNYQEKADQADDILLRGLQDNPESPDLLSYLAMYYYDMGKKDLAIQYYEKLVKASPGSTQAQADLADLKAGRAIGSPQ